MTDIEKPRIWILDSERTPLASGVEAFAGWAEITYIPQDRTLEWSNSPDAVFFSTEIAGGPTGELFADLLRKAEGIPLLAVARLRSLAQAVAYFRAGAVDYLSLPLDEDDARERLEAAMERAAQTAMQNVLVELQSVDDDAGEIEFRIHPPEPQQPHVDLLPESEEMEEVDILAQLSGLDRMNATSPIVLEREDPDGEEPELVDGLPIPTLWEELPCGLLVFDSSGNMVFSNTLGLDIFGHATLAELQDTLENRRHEFAAHGANHKPLPDNQWPQILAVKSHVARSAVISIEKPDKRRVWLRIDCLPHLSEGKITRLSMTLVNLTGDLPALSPPALPTTKQEKGKAHGKRR